MYTHVKSNMGPALSDYKSHSKKKENEEKTENVQSCALLTSMEDDMEIYVEYDA